MEIGLRPVQAWLQFGHDVSVVENGRSRRPPPFRRSLQFGHDVSVVENRRRRHDDRRPDDASIWPRRQRRGELIPVAKSPVVRRASIWPRRQRRGERPRGRGCGRRRAASIWPRRQRRGERAAGPERPGPGRDASIWPRRQRRGERSAVPASHCGIVALQFGHDVSVVENDDRRTPVAGDHPLLQFGHDVSVVENAVRRRASNPKGSCFNLATTSASWRTLAERRPGPRYDPASIWPRRQRRGERRDAAGWHATGTLASIWPRRQRRGEPLFSGPYMGVRTVASIWPRRQRRGEPRSARDISPTSIELQFGHDVSVVENARLSMCMIGPE